MEELTPFVVVEVSVLSVVLVVFVVEVSVTLLVVVSVASLAEVSSKLLVVVSLVVVILSFWLSTSLFPVVEVSDSSAYSTVVVVVSEFSSPISESVIGCVSVAVSEFSSSI